MMRIHPISTTVTLLMAAIVLAAPIVVNIILERTHQAADAPGFIDQHVKAQLVRTSLSSN